MASRRPLRLRVGEYPFAHAAAVEAAARVEHVPAECRDHLRQCRSPGLDDLPGDDVGIDDGHAELGEQPGHRGLAARDAAGQRD